MKPVTRLNLDLTFALIIYTTQIIFAIQPRGCERQFVFCFFVLEMEMNNHLKSIRVCVCTSPTTVLKINIKPLIEVTAEIPHGPLVLMRERLTGSLPFLFVTPLQ